MQPALCFACQTNNDEFEVRLQNKRVSYSSEPVRSAAFVALSQDLQRLLEKRYLKSLTRAQNQELQRYVHSVCGGLSMWELSPTLTRGLEILLGNKDVAAAANALSRTQNAEDRALDDSGRF
jgi:hypothetical protein